MDTPKAPCKGCADRCIEPNCHMTCALYLEYSKVNEALRAERKQKSVTGGPIKRVKHKPGETAWDALLKRSS